MVVLKIRKTEGKKRKNRTLTLYCAGKSSLHGPEIWIFPGFEVLSNFSALKTLLPNKQYLGKKVRNPVRRSSNQIKH